LRPSMPDILPDRKWRIPMKSMMLAAFIAFTVTAGIASVGIASLANGATTLLSATAHSGPYDNAANSLGGRAAETYCGN
jgi:hypothetical protein